MSNPIKIGMINEPFPVREGTEINPKTYSVNCLGQSIEITVSTCQLMFGDNGKYKLTGIITTPADVSKDLFMGGWGSHSHVDEAKAMIEAANKYCEEFNLELVQTYNNWPTLRASVNIK